MKVVISQYLFIRMAQYFYFLDRLADVGRVYRSIDAEAQSPGLPFALSWLSRSLGAPSLRCMVSVREIMLTALILQGLFRLISGLLDMLHCNGR